ncbi:hypothetical protein [Actinomycetospora termitidis]|uniref:Uncharacterized protein n=1 Tax=Actinomycetospora termitidis TaxID=3053470 RepID=A0ABT7MA64_9PSEU|nr:hypothetical protein [Actinomycetospora sp. Odt1-22]MDL5157546.1 hypothetical protein [Actinomycetospora sp. Odt1-22]
MAAQSDGERTEKAVEPRQDPWWPQVDGGHPITELMAPTQGAASPFGEVEFPLSAEQLGYEHPHTEINR